MAVVAVECRYRTPARLGDTLKVVSLIDELPAAKVVIRSEIYNQNEALISTGSVTLGFIDAVTRRPIRCPKILLDVFSDKF